jgi:2'-5' RNA ligase
VSCAALVALIAPDFAEQDRLWIEDLRFRHDPNHKIVAAHVTLIFPAPGFATPEAFAHVERVARGTAPFDIGFSGGAVETETERGETYVMMMAGEGGAALARLRETLVSGPLAKSQDPSRPYRPHLTLGRFADAGSAATLARRLVDESRSIAARATALTVAAYDGVSLGDWRRVAFESRAL